MIPSPIMPIMLTGIVAVVCFGLTALQTWRLSNAQETIGDLRGKIEFQKSQTQEAVDANENLKSQYDDLIDRINAMIADRQLERDEQDRILLAREEQLERANALARQLESERDAVFRTDPTCKEMGDIRVDLVCPVIASQLRQRSGHGSGHESGDSRDPG